MVGTWSEWLLFPDPSNGGLLTAPIGPGCYDLRLGNEKVLCGYGKNVAFRMTSLLPIPWGQGTRKNAEKREYVLMNLGLIKYRTVACKDVRAAKKLENELRHQGVYRFKT